MKLRLIDDDNELMNTFREASLTLMKKQTLFRRPTATIKDGGRHSTLDAYLKPALRRQNLHVLLKTQAVSVSSRHPTLRLMKLIWFSFFVHRRNNNFSKTLNDVMP